MSYIQVMFPDKVERGLKFNNLAVREFWKTIDIGRYNATANYAMVWGGLVGNYFAKGIDQDFTFEQVIDWVDQMTQEQVDAISVVLAGVGSYKEGVAKIEAAMSDVEKKSNTKKRKTTM